MISEIRWIKKVSILWTFCWQNNIYIAFINVVNRMSDLDSNWIVTKWGSVNQNVKKFILKRPRLVLFKANLSHFWPKSGIPVFSERSRSVTKLQSYSTSAILFWLKNDVKLESGSFIRSISHILVNIRRKVYKQYY